MRDKVIHRLPFSVATALKFHEGRRHHGDKWGGQRPLRECYAELIDAHVYLQLELSPNGLAREGSPISTRVEDLATVLATLAMQLRDIIEFLGDTVDDPFEIPEGRFGEWHPVGRVGDWE